MITPRWSGHPRDLTADRPKTISKIIGTSIEISLVRAG
jgi:hypothetical protein